MFNFETFVTFKYNVVDIFCTLLDCNVYKFRTVYMTGNRSIKAEKTK